MRTDSGVGYRNCPLSGGGRELVNGDRARAKNKKKEGVGQIKKNILEMAN